MDSKFRCRDFYLAAYLVSVMGAELPIADGRQWVFDDPSGELAWAENYYHNDQSVMAFVSAIKKLKGVLRDSSNAKG